MPDEDDLLPAELSPEELGQLDSILDHPIDRDRRAARRPVRAVRSARSSLVPLHHREPFDPPSKGSVTPGVRRVPRSAVQKEEDRTAPVLAPNRDPLLDPTDLDELALVDVIDRGDRELSRVP